MAEENTNRDLPPIVLKAEFIPERSPTSTAPTLRQALYPEWWAKRASDNSEEWLAKMRPAYQDYITEFLDALNPAYLERKGLNAVNVKAAVLAEFDKLYPVSIPNFKNSWYTITVKVCIRTLWITVIIRF